MNKNRFTHQLGEVKRLQATGAGNTGTPLEMKQGIVSARAWASSSSNRSREQIRMKINVAIEILMSNLFSALSGKISRVLSASNVRQPMPTETSADGSLARPLTADCGMDDRNGFCCPNSDCPDFAHRGRGNRAF
jgi:hypothetical protein